MLGNIVKMVICVVLLWMQRNWQLPVLLGLCKLLHFVGQPGLVY